MKIDQRTKEIVKQSDEHKLLRCWTRFKKRFPTEQSCLDELLRRATNGKFRCRKCDSTDLTKEKNGRVQRCNSCNKDNWVLAGTILEGIRKPRAWLAALYFFEHGVVISSSQFHRFLEVAQSTGLKIFKAITGAVRKTMERLPKVPAAQFLSIVCKRSRKTPADVHPIAEQEALEKKLFEKKQELWKSEEQLSPTERTVLNTLSNNAELHFDQLAERTGLQSGLLSAALTVLELNQLVKRNSGDWYSRRVPLSEFVDPTLSMADLLSTTVSFVNFINSKFHGISRRYLQNYLAAYWCYIDNEHWSSALNDVCMYTSADGYLDTMNYESPLLVNIPIRS